MHDTLFIRPIPTPRRALLGTALVVLTSLAIPSSIGGTAAAEVGVATIGTPHLLTGPVADTIVRVQGGAVCSGTPITGTNLVVTAAHCVLDSNGEPAQRIVERDGVEYPAVAVIVDTRYHDTPSALLDAAVLVMDQPIPGGGATLAQLLPTHGTVTLAGFQALDTDATLLRGEGPRDHVQPKGTAGYVALRTAPAGCTRTATALQVSDRRVTIECGLIPGASGGGLFTVVDGELLLAGIVSTVSADLTSNNLVPLPALLSLLDNADAYTHTVSAPPPSRTHNVYS